MVKTFQFATPDKRHIHEYDKCLVIVLLNKHNSFCQIVKQFRYVFSNVSFKMILVVKLDLGLEKYGAS